MGDKTAARSLAAKVNVPTLPGTEEPVSRPEQAPEDRPSIGFPLIIKAAFGGGGRGMRVVREESSSPPARPRPRPRPLNAFGNGRRLPREKFVGRAKHIEVQILGDKHGNIVHLHERDCSVQRRHQKVIEIAPLVETGDPVVRKELCEAAVKLAKGIGYNNAGTVEFLVDMDQASGSSSR
jgi:pyruvate carboxylase